MADSTTSPSSTGTTSPPTSLSNSGTPTGTRDSAPGSSNNPESSNNNNNNGVPMTSYYFVFLMLMLCVIGIVIFLNFRRRRKRRLQLLQGYGNVTYNQQQQHAQQGRAARYWPGRWGSTNVSREEGLNEQGEAPPPYVAPKSFGQHDGGETGNAGPAVPMQTLNRDGMGYRPPAYEEQQDEDMMRPPPGAPSSSQPGWNR